MGPVWAHTAEIVCCHTYDKQPHFLNSIFCGNLDIQMFQMLKNTHPRKVVGSQYTLEHQTILQRKFLLSFQ